MGAEAFRIFLVNFKAKDIQDYVYRVCIDFPRMLWNLYHHCQKLGVPCDTTQLSCQISEGYNKTLKKVRCKQNSHVRVIGQSRPELEHRKSRLFASFASEHFAKTLPLRKERFLPALEASSAARAALEHLLPDGEGLCDVCGAENDSELCGKICNHQYFEAVEQQAVECKKCLSLSSLCLFFVVSPQKSLTLFTACVV